MRTTLNCRILPSYGAELEGCSSIRRRRAVRQNNIHNKFKGQKRTRNMTSPFWWLPERFSGVSPDVGGHRSTRPPPQRVRGSVGRPSPASCWDNPRRVLSDRGYGARAPARHRPPPHAVHEAILCALQCWPGAVAPVLSNTKN